VGHIKGYKIMKWRVMMVAALTLAACDQTTEEGDTDGSAPDRGAAADARPERGRDAPAAPDRAAPDAPAPDTAAGDASPCKRGEFLVLEMTTPKCKTLPSSVSLPVDSATEADAVKAASGCSCKCEQGWSLKGSKWSCSCCSKYPDCLVEVDVSTATTRCAYYG
jgi:hypothetical protein